MATSEDFEHWTDHGEVLTPNGGDPPETEFYGMVGFRYLGWSLGFLEMFKILERRLDTQLVRLDSNGRPKRFMQGQTFLDHGDWSDWDASWAFPGNCAPIRVGEELRIYYHGRKTLHWSDPATGGVGHIGAIGLARIRKDGWVYMQAGADGGTLTTAPLQSQGCCISVNADASEGELRAELLDEKGKVIPGYSLDNCYPLKTDATYWKLNWAGKWDLQEMMGRKISIRFQLTGTKLYAFRFRDKMSGTTCQ